MLYRWNFAPVFENLDVLWAGALGTLRLFAICVVLGFGFGLVVGLGRHARAVSACLRVRERYRTSALVR